MPRQAKFSREEIIGAAIKIVENTGEEALTARSLGLALGASARPIFTVFSGMEEVTEGVAAKANEIYQSYVKVGLSETPAFKGVGTAYIRFAKEHPKLFQLLFMKEQGNIPDVQNVLGVIEESYREIVKSIVDSYGVSEERAKELYRHMWIYSHGIAVLIATKMCTFTDGEISDMLTAVFKGLIINGVKK